MNKTESRITLDLKSALSEWGVNPPGGIDDEQSLIGSGLVDSMALFNLACWIEDRTGQPIDPLVIDLRREWDSVAAIARFVAVRTGR